MASSSSIKKMRIGINGMGTMGRWIAKIALQSNDVEVELVAVNDPSITTDDLVEVFTSDGVQGLGMRREVKIKDEKTILIGDKAVRVFGIRNGEEIPWKETGADYIVETDGVFTDDKDGAAAVNLNAMKMNPIGSLPVTKRCFKMRKAKLNWKKLNKFKKMRVILPEATRNFEEKLHPKNPNGNEEILRAKRAETKRMRDEFGEMRTALESWENEHKLLKTTNEWAVAEMEMQSEMVRDLMLIIFPPEAPNNDDEEN